MNRFSLLTLAALIAAAPLAAKADTTINLNATVSNGTAIAGTPNTLAPSFFSTLTLGPGTYTATVVGTSTANAVYNGWSQAVGSNGLAGAGTWQERVGFSTGGTTFSNAGGNNTYSPYPNPTDAQIFKLGSGSCSAGNCFDSGSAALAAVTAAGLNTYTFTLASTTAVTFYIPDQSYPVYPGFTDNTGGVSISLAATPEPSSLIMLATGALTTAGMIKRRFNA